MKRWPAGIAWLIAAATLFLIGALANGVAGARELTELGVVGAVVAIAFLALQPDACPSRPEPLVLSASGVYAIRGPTRVGRPVSWRIRRAGLLR
jgi:hypothetical protein